MTTYEERIEVVETDDLDIRELRLITDPQEPNSWIIIGRAILGYRTEEPENRGYWSWSARELGIAYDIGLLENIVQTLKTIPVPPYEEYEAAFPARMPVGAGLAAATPEGYEPEEPAPCPVCGEGVTEIVGQMWPLTLTTADGMRAARVSLEPCGHAALLAQQPDGGYDLVATEEE